METGGHLTVTPGDRESVVGWICALLDAELLFRDSRFTRVCQVFDGYKDTELPGGNAKAIALEACALMDNGGGESELSQHLARFQQEVPAPEGGSRIELPTFASRMLDAYRARTD
jgi:hypothetical protein